MVLRSWELLGCGDLERKGGVVLLEKVVPDVERPVHLGCEEHPRPRRRPAPGLGG